MTYGNGELPNGGWIPVSERLPEKEGRYLTTILNEHDNRLRYVMTCDYLSNGCWCPDDECASSNVVAWMPLPDPFESQESESKRYAELAKSYVQGLRAGLAESEDRE